MIAATDIRRDGSDETVEVPQWIERLQELDPVRVLSGHDTATWSPAG